MPVGRPKGHRLSQESKDAISKTKLGYSHDEETKDKISKSMVQYYVEHPEAIERIRQEKTIHGLANTILNRKWSSIKKRCSNENDPAYKYYGAKGIDMCEEWKHDFVVFKDWCMENGWKKNLHMHRVRWWIGYQPSNCVFITPSLHSKLHAAQHDFERINGIIN